MSVGRWSNFYISYIEVNIIRYVPRSAGVYSLWVHYTNGKWRCFYVGKADNLKSCLLDHLKSEEPNMCIEKKVKHKCGFMWIEVTTGEERSGAEKYLYESLKLECKQNDPGGKPLKIPLPLTPPATAPSK